MFTFTHFVFSLEQGISQKDYEAKKELVADEIISRLEKKLFPGLKKSIVFKEVHYNNSLVNMDTWSSV